MGRMHKLRSPIGKLIFSDFFLRFVDFLKRLDFFDFCKKSEILSGAANRFLRENSEIREVQNHKKSNRFPIVKILLLFLNFGYILNFYYFLTPHTARTDPITLAHVFQTAVR